VKNSAEHDATLAEVARSFISSLPPTERSEVQAQVLKFVRWIGSSRKVSDLSPVDVAGYGELTTPSAVRPVRAFLTYVRKKGFTGTSLSPHLRVRKASSKAGIMRRKPHAAATLTAQGYAELESELEALKSQLPEVIDEIQRAAADKDFKENAPLAAARERKAYLEGRIREMESTLTLARIMGTSQGISTVKPGDTVVLCDLSSGSELSYVLVHPREANPTKGKLSVASPLGKVILDKEKGQTVEVTAPAGSFRYRIESIAKAGE